MKLVELRSAKPPELQPDKRNHYFHNGGKLAIMVTVMPAKAPSQYPRQVKLLKALGARLRLARLRRRYSVVQVAERADVSRPTLNKVERGDGAVTLGTYVRVLAVLGLDADLELLAADDTMGRRLQDAGLDVPRRAPKRLKKLTTVVEERPEE